MASTGPRSIPSESVSGQLMDNSMSPRQGQLATPTQTEAASTPIEMSEYAKSQQNPGSTSIGIGSDVHNTTEDMEEFRPINMPPPTEDPINTTSPPLTREATRPAIGAATDRPSFVTKEVEIEGPVLYITLLLTTGARHPFRLDQKYLRKRNVEVEGNNPVNMSLYKLKELILRDWREEWEAKPSSPESIRLISMGKLLTDKSKLADFGFKDGAAPTIIHMTIKPQDIVDEEEANKNPRDRDRNERSPGCRCTIM